MTDVASIFSGNLGTWILFGMCILVILAWYDDPSNGGTP